MLKQEPPSPTHPRVTNASSSHASCISRKLQKMPSHQHFFFIFVMRRITASLTASANFGFFSLDERDDGGGLGMRGRGENSRVDLSGTCRSMVHASAPLDWLSLLVFSGLAPAARRVFSIRVEMLKKKLYSPCHKSDKRKQ